MHVVQSKRCTPQISDQSAKLFTRKTYSTRLHCNSVFHVKRPFVQFAALVNLGSFLPLAALPHHGVLTGIGSSLSALTGHWPLDPHAAVRPAEAAIHSSRSIFQVKRRPVDFPDFGSIDFNWAKGPESTLVLGAFGRSFGPKWRNYRENTMSVFCDIQHNSVSDSVQRIQPPVFQPLVAVCCQLPRHGIVIHCKII